MKRKNSIIVVIVLIIVVVAGAAVFLLKPNSPKEDEVIGEQVHTKDVPTISYNGKTYTYNTDLETVLFIGLDGVTEEDEISYNNQVQSDYVTLIVMNHDTQSMRILQLNRDTICSIPILDTRGNESGRRDAQLALAHTYGSGDTDSCKNVVKTVEDFLYDIDIDHYFSISVNSISTLNDVVGGVTVTLEDDFSYADPAMTKGSTIHLMGDQAELYVRNRKGLSDETNIGRMARQKNYMNEWLKVADQALENDENVVVDALLDISDDLVSDMSVYTLADVIEAASHYELEKIISPEGSSDMQDGHMVFYADEDALMKTVVDVFYE